MYAQLMMAPEDKMCSNICPSMFVYGIQKTTLKVCALMIALAIPAPAILAVY